MNIKAAHYIYFPTAYHWYVKGPSVLFQLSQISGNTMTYEYSLDIGV